MDGLEQVISIVSLLLLLGASVVLLATGTLLLEAAAAFFPAGTTTPPPAEETRETEFESSLPSIAVIIPAHNESADIGTVLGNVKNQLGNGDRLLVVADNCTDNTAEIARTFGVEVIERCDPERRGKGYALDRGLVHLRENPPDVVVMLDADCQIAADGIARIAELAASTGNPIQSTYVLNAPLNEDTTDPSPKRALSAFAFRVKNYVRPRGLSRLGLPCLLTGTGMAFPWEILATVDIASGNIVEDMKLGIDLTLQGYPPRFCDTVRVTGTLPENQTDARTQRQRWEHGHLRTLLTDVPRLLVAAIRQRRLDVLALALELSVPPLSLLVLAWGGMTAVATGWFWGTGVGLPLQVLGISGLCMTLAVLGSWAMVGRQDMSLKTLLSVPFYIVWKIPLYAGFVAAPEQEWVRTKRASES